MFTVPPREAEIVILPKEVDVDWFKPTRLSWSIVNVPPETE